MGHRGARQPAVTRRAETKNIAGITEAGYELALSTNFLASRREP